MRNDDRPDDRPSAADLRLTLGMPLKLDGTASGGIGYTDIIVPAMVDGTAAISIRTVAADDPCMGGGS